MLVDKNIRIPKISRCTSIDGSTADREEEKDGADRTALADGCPRNKIRGGR